MSERIKGLDGLRAIAVLMVYFAHRSSLGNDLGLGGSAVRMFFVLSGFLIIGILHTQRKRIEAGGSSFWSEWRYFNIRRAFRILPIYLVCVLYIALAFDHDNGFIIRCLTYTENLYIAFVSFHYPGNGGHLWSLSVEEQFYLLSAPLILLLPSRHTVALCWATIVLAVASSVLIMAVGFPDRAIYNGPANFGLMAVGGLVALSAMRLKLPSWVPIAALAAFLAISVSIRGNLSPVLNFLAAMIATPILVAAVIQGVTRNQSSLLVRLLDLAPMRFLGRISYAFYLFHPFVKIEALAPMPHSLAVFVDLAGTIALCAASWQFFEGPLLSLGHRLAKRRHHAAFL